MNLNLSFTEPQKCLIGAILIKFSFALLITWGKCNIYYYSYYKYFQPDLPLSYNSLPIAIMAIPLVILSILSLKIAQKIGYVKLIRICCFTQVISLIISNFMHTYILFIIFYLVIIGNCYALCGYPLLGAVWNCYPNQEGRITGFIIGVFSLGTLFYVLTMTVICNPNNEKAELEVQVGESTYKYFNYDIGQHVPSAVSIATLISGISSATGAMLISYNQGENIQENNPKIIELQQYDSFESQQLIIAPLFQKEQSTSGQKQELKAAILSTQFRILFFAQFSLMFYMITLGINFKEYSLSKINNDYFVTFADSFALLTSGILSFVWGILVDKMSFVKMFTALYFLSGVSGLLLALTSGQYHFLIFYLSLTLFDKGSVVIIGPGLVKIFGNSLGTQLYPILNVGAILSFIASPLTQLLLESLISFNSMLVLCGMLIIIASYFNYKLDMNYQIMIE